MDRFKQCSGKQLPDGFRWQNEPKEWSFQGEQLQVQAPAGADFFVDPLGDAHRDSAPYLYTELTGDFTVVTRADAKMESEFDSACLMLWQDETHWAKVCYEMSYGWPSLVSVVTKGYSDDCNTLMTLAEPPYLRISRYGDTISMHYSLDEKNWYMLRYFRMDLQPTIRVGVVAQSPGGDGCSVWFSGFSVKAEPVTDIRGGV